MSLSNFYSTLAEHDPDAVVDMLGVTSEELLDAFPEKVEALYLKEGFTDDDEVSRD